MTQMKCPNDPNKMPNWPKWNPQMIQMKCQLTQMKCPNDQNEMPDLIEYQTLYGGDRYLTLHYRYWDFFKKWGIPDSFSFI